jgi:hypothetical protein
LASVSKPLARSQIPYTILRLQFHSAKAITYMENGHQDRISHVSHSVTETPQKMHDNAAFSAGDIIHFSSFKLDTSAQLFHGIATGYGLDDRGVGVQVQVGPRIFFSARRPDRLRGPPNLLSNGYRGLFPRG